MTRIVLAVLGACLMVGMAAAGEPEVVDAKATRAADGSYRFDVTIRHGDTGWDHYADRWDILDEDGKILGTRVLLHPHENEQPFTRSLTGVRIPQSVTRVSVRARDKVHGFGSKLFVLDLP